MHTTQKKNKTSQQMQVMENKLSILFLNETTIANQLEVAVSELTTKRVQDVGGGGFIGS